MFNLTPMQRRGREVLNGPALNVLAAGGSRSGKTTLIVRNILLRAACAPESRHLIFRSVRADLVRSIWLDTLPKVLKTDFGGMPVKTDEKNLILKLPHNKSEIWLGFLNESGSLENVLGNEYATIYANECSQISYKAVLMARTRLAQNCRKEDGSKLRLKFYYDENPPSKLHWTYKEFVLKQNPRDGEALKNPEDYAFFYLNPKDNADNLDESYFSILENLPREERERFLLGLWGGGVAGAIYNEELARAQKEGRIAKAPYNPAWPCYAVFDIGTCDNTVIWFVQFVGEKIFFIDFYSNTGQGFPHYDEVIKSRNYGVRTLFFPHDGANKDWSTGSTRREAAISAGYEVEILPRLNVWDGINIVRQLFARFVFDAQKCADGLECLHNYRKEYNLKLDVEKPEPVHDWASHAADGVRYVATAYESMGKYIRPKEQTISPSGVTFASELAKRRRRRMAE